MYCKRCGNKLKEDAKFCPRCGEKVHANAKINNDRAIEKTGRKPSATKKYSL